MSESKMLKLSGEYHADVNLALEEISKLEADKKDLQAKLADLSNSTLGRIADLELFLSDITKTFGGIDNPSVKTIVDCCNNVLNK